MATTLYQFTPTADVNFSFQPTLDGTQYNVVITWSLAGQHWIVNVFTLQGTLIVSKPLRGSPDNARINIIAGYFTSTSLCYRVSSNNFEVATS